MYLKVKGSIPKIESFRRLTRNPFHFLSDVLLFVEVNFVGYLIRINNLKSQISF